MKPNKVRLQIAAVIDGLTWSDTSKRMAADLLWWHSRAIIESRVVEALMDRLDMPPADKRALVERLRFEATEEAVTFKNPPEGYR